MEKQEDKTTCAECGGYCCKRCGCDYFVSDFESMKLEYLENALDTGRVSIVAAMKFTTMKNGVIVNNPVLYMRARNQGRGEIDLLSFKTTCASLQEDGCYFDLDNRPSGGATLIPKMDDKGNLMCYSSVNRIKELKKWFPHQSVLQKLVKKRTGLDVDAKLRQDVENLLFDIQEGNYKNVSKAELLDVLGMIPVLCKAYPEEVKRANKRRNLLLYRQHEGTVTKRVHKTLFNMVKDRFELCYSYGKKYIGKG